MLTVSRKTGECRGARVQLGDSVGLRARSYAQDLGHEGEAPLAGLPSESKPYVHAHYRQLLWALLCSLAVGWVNDSFIHSLLHSFCHVCVLSTCQGAGCWACFQPEAHGCLAGCEAGVRGQGGMFLASPRRKGWGGCVGWGSLSEAALLPPSPTVWPPLHCGQCSWARCGRTHAGRARCPSR